MSPAWAAVPAAVVVAGLVLALVAAAWLDARRKRWAAMWEGFDDEAADEGPWLP